MFASDPVLEINETQSFFCSMFFCVYIEDFGASFNSKKDETTGSDGAGGIFILSS